ncbi:hypothetical protein Taro_026260 [Colocasia esculenta]|uniref:Uncharacterized protein n=1 Tax=Colocasia esculenta TaxID=4460 RepID=A0A843VEQ7_COLES|nr:hypothetical protein [Colocasia esculenta]
MANREHTIDSGSNTNWFLENLHQNYQGIVLVSRGDTWLFLPDLVEVRDVGACVVRLWSHMVAPVFRELRCLGGCVPRCCFRVVLALLLFEFIAYLTGLNSNPSGSSDPWVAARPSGVPGGGSGRLGRYRGLDSRER